MTSNSAVTLATAELFVSAAVETVLAKAARLSAVDKMAAEENMRFTAKAGAHVKADSAWTNQAP
jgi:hypothetical protein